MGEGLARRTCQKDIEFPTTQPRMPQDLMRTQAVNVTLIKQAPFWPVCPYGPASVGIDFDTGDRLKAGCLETEVEPAGPGKQGYCCKHALTTAVFLGIAASRDPWENACDDTRCRAQCLSDEVSARSRLAREAR